MRIRKTFLAVALALGATGAAQAADDLKIGMVLPMSGPFAAYGEQILAGARLYLQQHDEKLGDRKVELVVKDDTGVAPAVSRRVAQELVNRDKVDVLAGFGLTPSAFAVGPLATQAKVPMVVMNAATSSVTEKSPYIVRTSMALPQITAPIATWAVENGIKRVYTVVADYGPGHDAEKQFIETFTEAGGEIVGQVRTPVANPDFAPFLQRVKDTKPDAVFLFVPAGEQGVSFLKGYQERGLADEGIKLISTGDLTDEDVLDAMGQSVGVMTSFHYSEAHDSELNKQYVQSYYKAYPGKRPNFMSVAGYDGMHLIDAVLKKTGGDASGDTFIEAAKGLAWESPRGQVAIDPETRDIVQDIYIREVKEVDGKLQNVEFDRIPEFKDPVKAKN
ncbi:ABC transporter substrate-binding protein [Pusillimonas noertemannii]|uniref:Branched-chain amino acid transport system substrate-binding protein n=1 Tax=Pusillimonas noertemannii TaxID=305977 RepID=A0A2U1CJ07_9BURK|nr:ABC transporter substrate-binding protein [Pusillimonas noertemannii]NYT70025.1 ABC transporter substrate-binding protein [Pusillimonas noertemannii]PVY60975.1 branched-chain amino acid transport system substrate-binding protein [Pusillimonas noertemannii]TFL08369.1 ABC transporter substrate-binding protein [Pusillimonas noertemannii]